MLADLARRLGYGVALLLVLALVVAYGAVLLSAFGVVFLLFAVLVWLLLFRYRAGRSAGATAYRGDL